MSNYWNSGRPIGQLIISAAVVDDMLALVILSLLETLTGDVSVTGIVKPVVASICFLFGGCYLAVKVFPGKFDLEWSVLNYDATNPKMKPHLYLFTYFQSLYMIIFFLGFRSNDIPGYLWVFCFFWF